MNAQKRMLALLSQKVGTVVSRNDLATVAQVHDWQRSLRTLRQSGYDIESVTDGYILHSLVQRQSNKQRVAINNKLRYQILHRDLSTCQRCGRTPQDGIKLEVDHKIPVEWGGKTEADNLWTLCNECNGGKKHFFADLDGDIMKEVMKEASGWRRLMKIFELMPNTVIEPTKLQVISEIRDWTRTIRSIREKHHLDIEWIKPNTQYPNGGYIYHARE